jgi:solute carrier family 50 protein (sugar transporter)
MELENILPFLKIFNAITIILLNASPLVGLFKIIKKKEKYTYLPFCMLLFFSLNSLCWTCYWFKNSNMIFMLSYYISTIIDSGFLIIYLYFLCKYNKRFLISSFLLIVIEVTIVISVLLFIIEYLNFYRRCLIVISTIMYISPGQNLIKVFKEKACKFIPIFSTMAGILCSGGWLLFGKIIDDIYIIIPNGLGLIFSTIYTLIWLIYYIKERIDKKKSVFYPEDNNKTRDVEIG